MSAAESDPHIRRLIRRGAPAVLPIGATEQHGAHLPASTDSDIVEAVSRGIAERNGYLLLPTIRYGVSHEHAPLLNLSVTRAALRATIRDLCSSLASNGIRTVFIVNGHHGNLGALRRPFSGRGMPRVLILHYWRHMGMELGHAGRAETSLMLAVSDMVDMSRARRGLVTDGMPKKEIARLERMAQESFPDIAKGGIWGDPRGATKREGRALLAGIVEELGKRCQTCLTGGGS